MRKNIPAPRSASVLEARNEGTFISRKNWWGRGRGEGVGTEI